MELALSSGRPNLCCRVVLSGFVVLPRCTLAAVQGCIKILRILCRALGCLVFICWPWSFRGRSVSCAKGEPIQCLVSYRPLADKRARVLFIETGSPPHYELTRRFYLKHGYEQHALLKDFYADGDSMVVFRKALT